MKKKLKTKPVKKTDKPKVYFNGCYWCDYLHRYGYRGCDKCFPSVEPNPKAPSVEKKKDGRVEVGKLRGVSRERTGRVMYAKAGKCPIALDGESPAEVLRWAEEVRDHFEDRKEFITLPALKLYATVILSAVVPWADRVEQVHSILDGLYPHEAEEERLRADALINKSLAAPKVDLAAPEPPEPKRKKLEVNTDTPVKVEATQGREGGNRYNLFGHNVTSVLRWMGKNKWNFQMARSAMNKLKLPVADATLNAQLRAGVKGERGDPAPITPDQERELNALVSKPSSPAAPDAAKAKPTVSTSKKSAGSPSRTAPTVVKDTTSRSKASKKSKTRKGKRRTG